MTNMNDRSAHYRFQGWRCGALQVLAVVLVVSTMSEPLAAPGATDGAQLKGRAQLPGEDVDPPFLPLLYWKPPRITKPINVYPAALIDEPLTVIDYDVFRRRLAYDLAAQRAVANGGRPVPLATPASTASGPTSAVR